MLLWGFLGWTVRVCYTYYAHSKKVEAKKGGRFVWNTFKKKYDQDWIMGFVGMIALSLISDWAWGAFLSEMILSKVTVYDPKVNVLLGFMAIYLIEKANKKNE